MAPGGGPGRRIDLRGRAGRRRADDAGGVWIITGIVLGVLLYAGIVVMEVAGFTPVAPLVVIPPVLLGLIAANNLLGGGRSHGRSPGRPVGGGQAPLSSSGPNGPVKPAKGAPPQPGPVAGEPPEPR
jgi:hypothetical protein